MNPCKHVQMSHFEILSPRWHDHKVLLKDQKLGAFNKITFTGKDGESMGDQPYVITGKTARSFPTEMMETRDGRQVKMRVVPIESLKLLELESRCEHSD